MTRISKNWLRWRLRYLCEKESLLILKKKSKIGNFWNRNFLLLSMVTSETIGLKDFADDNAWDRRLLQKKRFFQKTIFALFCFLVGMARFCQLFLTNKVFSLISVEKKFTGEFRDGFWIMIIFSIIKWSGQFKINALWFYLAKNVFFRQFSFL